MRRSSFFFSPAIFWLSTLIFALFVVLLLKNADDLNGGDDHVTPLEREVRSLQHTVQILEDEEKNRMSQYYKEKTIRNELNMKKTNEEVLQVETYNIISTPTPTPTTVLPVYRQWQELLF